MSVWRDQLLHLMCTCYCFPSRPTHTFILYLFFSFSSSCLFCILSLLSLTFHITLHLSRPAPLSWRPLYLPLLSILAPLERNAVIFLLLPKPQLENIGPIKVKGKGLKRKVFHASCEWYAGTENGKVPSLFFSLPISLSLCSLCIITAPLLVSSRHEVSDLSVD